MKKKYMLSEDGFVGYCFDEKRQRSILTDEIL